MDDVEARLLAAVVADPDDREARMVYADWLDDHGDPRGQYLRLESQLHSIPAQLAALAPTIDPAWLDRVSRYYDVVLVAAGTSKIMAVKGIRAATKLGLKDSVDLLDRLAPDHPVYLARDVERAEADRAIAEFDGTDAVVQRVSRSARV